MPPSRARRIDARDTIAPCPLPPLDLLGHFLAHSLPDDDALSLAARLLERYDDLNGVCAGVADAAAYGLIAPPAQAEIVRLQAFAEVLARPRSLDRRSVSSWTALLDYLRTAHAGLPRERFRVLYLDRRNRLIADDWTADGTVDHAPAYPREVILGALRRSASALILVHNHPSGDPTPSQADIAMTRQVVEAGRALGVSVHDHVIVGRDGVTSFRQKGLL